MMMTAAVFWAWRPEFFPLNFSLSSDGADRVLSDPRVLAFSWDGLISIVKENYWWPKADTQLYRPVTTLSFLAGNFTAGSCGWNTSSFQILLNLLLHAVNAGAIALMVKRLTRRPDLAALVGLLWAFHPGHLEVVVGAAGRADILALFFGLAGVHCWFNNRRMVAFVAMGLAFLSKEVGCFFFAVPILMRPFEPKGTMRQALSVLCGGVLFVGLVHCWRIQTSVENIIYPSDNPLVLLSAPHRACAAAGVLLQQTFRWLTLGPTFFDGSFPSPEICDHIFGTRAATTFFADLFSLVVLVAGTLAGCWFFWRRKISGFAVLWFVGAMLPVSNIFVPIGTSWGDRLLYIPSVGIFFAIALLFHSSFLHRFRGTSAVVVTFLALLMSLEVVIWLVRSGDWQSPGTFALASLRQAPESYRVNMNCARFELATTKPFAERLQRAAPWAEAAVRPWEQCGLPLWQQDSESFALLGQISLYASREVSGGEELRRTAEARLRQSITIDEAQRSERHARAALNGRKLVPLGNLTPYQLLVAQLVDEKRWAEAEEIGGRLRYLEPASPGLYVMFSKIFRGQGRLREAIIADTQAQIVSGKRLTAIQRTTNLSMDVDRAVLREAIDDLVFNMRQSLRFEWVRSLESAAAVLDGVRN